MQRGLEPSDVLSILHNSGRVLGVQAMSLGRGASSDGTFRLMQRTKTDGRVLLLIIGDDGTVVSYYVLRSESWPELEPGLERRPKMQLDHMAEMKATEANQAPAVLADTAHARLATSALRRLC